MILELLGWAIALPPLLALSVFCIEVASGLPRLRQGTASSSATYVVLVPAHNEQPSIAGTVRALQSQLTREGRILVVADNCEDDTCRSALGEGAEAIERCEPERRGKGFALAHGRDHLAGNPPDVVVVMDADCTMSRDSILELVASAHSLAAPVQAINLLHAPRGAPAMVEISNFAMLIKNLVRARGVYRMGGGIPLFGTGMAFPWGVFAQADLAHPDTVEDLRLAIDLARRGVAAHLIERALVVSLAAAEKDTLGQRRRWEHGFLRTAIEQAVPLLALGLARRSRHKVALALHLCVPPLALLLLTGAASATLTFGMALLGGNWWAPIALLGALVASLGLVLCAWIREGRSTVTLGVLASAPVYVLKKLPMYLGMLFAGPATWNRTPRDREPD